MNTGCCAHLEEADGSFTEMQCWHLRRGVPTRRRGGGAHSDCRKSMIKCGVIWKGGAATDDDCLEQQNTQ
jgi:hypothetical protein